jgi:hypothetical protein
MNHWVITKEWIDDKRAVGLTNTKKAAIMQLSEFPYQFRMYDDDGNLYYEGRMTELDFGPLDDYGMPNAGCTELWHLNDGKWEMM